MPRQLARVRVTPLDATGPEDVVVHDGVVITGVVDGRILRVDPDSGRTETLADTGGRPLGIELYADGRLLVCDAHRGLLVCDRKSGRIETLVAEYGGRPLRFCNNAAVAADGTVYFSDSSAHFGVDNWRGELIARSGTGRLLRRTTAGEVDVLADGLQFANGVALAADESYVVVAQTGDYRLDRIWLTGDRAGHREVLVELPGFPDNLSTGSDGLIWVAVPNPRDPVFDVIVKTPPAVRRRLAGLPVWLQPRAKRYWRTMAVDGSGTVVHDLTGPGERFHMVTSVRQHDGQLWFGSLTEAGIAVADMPS
ncbi:MAG: SMP-30/gluconolactonase/LRE family protein [Micromonosporaceae bacterium]